MTPSKRKEVVNSRTDPAKGYQLLGAHCRYPPQAKDRRKERGMSDPTSRDSREPLQELAASHQLARCGSQHRRTRWASRTATALGLALILATGMAGISPVAFAEPTAAASDSGAESAKSRNFESDLSLIFDRIRNQLERQVQMKTDAIVQQATEHQINVLLQQFEQKLAISHEISRRVERQLAKLSQ